MKFDKLIKRARSVIPLINPQNKSFHCSFLLNKNKIVGFGWNQSFKSHTLGKMTGTRFECIHSEHHAIIRCRWRIDRLDKLTLVNTRFRRDGTIGQSKPCEPCRHLLRMFSITDIWYTNDDGKFQQII